MNRPNQLGDAVTQLHSAYRPQEEADRYIKALDPDSGVDWFILIEPGQGYLVNSLKNQRPGAGIVVLHADAVFRKFSANFPGVPAWYPDSGMGVQEFLESSIPESSSARIIEWRPSLRVYGESCLSLIRVSSAFLKRAEASRRTSTVFGKKWVRNFFRNIAFLQSTLLYATMDMPVLITGSGPGLEAVLPQILAARGSVFLLAASSSLAALTTAGITPDMVISTDGGGWALLHLHEFCRKPWPFLACSYLGPTVIPVPNP
jgi:hypothetical protein